MPERLVGWTFIFIQALVFMMLLHHYSDDEVDIRWAIVLATLSDIGPLVMAISFPSFIGLWGMGIGFMLGVILAGAGLSFIFGMCIRRAFRIAGAICVLQVILLLTAPSLLERLS